MPNKTLTKILFSLFFTSYSFFTSHAVIFSETGEKLEDLLKLAHEESKPFLQACAIVLQTDEGESLNGSGVLIKKKGREVWILSSAHIFADSSTFRKKGNYNSIHFVDENKNVIMALVQKVFIPIEAGPLDRSPSGDIALVKAITAVELPFEPLSLWEEKIPLPEHTAINCFFVSCGKYGVNGEESVENPDFVRHVGHTQVVMSKAIDDLNPSLRNYIWTQNLSLDVPTHFNQDKPYLHKENGISISFKPLSNQAVTVLGDSGSPLIFQSEGKPFIIGIASGVNLYSRFQGPQLLSDVFTPIKPHQGWIQKILNGYETSPLLRVYNYGVYFDPYSSPSEISNNEATMSAEDCFAIIDILGPHLDKEYINKRKSFAGLIPDTHYKDQQEKFMTLMGSTLTLEEKIEVSREFLALAEGYYNKGLAEAKEGLTGVLRLLSHDLRKAVRQTDNSNIRASLLKEALVYCSDLVRLTQDALDQNYCTELKRELALSLLMWVEDVGINDLTFPHTQNAVTLLEESTPIENFKGEEKEHARRMLSNALIAFATNLLVYKSNSKDLDLRETRVRKSLAIFHEVKTKFHNVQEKADLLYALAQADLSFLLKLKVSSAAMSKAEKIILANEAIQLAEEYSTCPEIIAHKESHILLERAKKIKDQMEIYLNRVNNKMD